MEVERVKKREGGTHPVIAWPVRVQPPRENEKEKGQTQLLLQDVAPVWEYLSS